MGGARMLVKSQNIFQFTTCGFIQQRIKQQPHAVQQVGTPRRLLEEFKHRNGPSRLRWLIVLAQR